MFGRLLSAFGAAAVRGEVDAVVGRIRLRAILLVGAAVLWLLAVGFALAAFTVWLSGVVGPIAACLILAVVFALGGAALYGWQTFAKRRATPLFAVLSQAIAPLKQAADAEAAAQGGSEATDAVPPDRAAREAGSVGAILVLAAIGYVIGRTLTER